MTLTSNDKKYLVDKLPDIELSYDKIIHNKVYADLYLIIPKGKKALVWFTYFNEKNICFVLELDASNNINNIYPVSYCFDNELAYNTILLGTLKNINNTTFFTCENILYYKNTDLKQKNFKTKLMLINDFFKNIKNTTYISHNFIISMPIIKKNYTYALNETQFLNYETYGIQAIRLNDYEALGIIKIEKKIEEVAFKVMADIKPDIYKLYCLENNKFVFHCIAMIPDYKTSVFMNNLFRTIKENKNLDLLEESDDDEEFENINEDKYVDINKHIVMNCVYLDKFKKWKPISISNKHSKIISKQELYKLQKNKYTNNI